MFSESCASSSSDGAMSPDSVANLSLRSCANSSTSTSPSTLKFSIDNILQPNFGQRSDVSLAALQHCMMAGMGKQSPVPTAAAPPLPAWIYCTRYSDRPSSGPRIRKTKKKGQTEEEKRPRTAFTVDQLERLKEQFMDNKYLTEKRRQELAHELGLNESQIKIWFQNKRAKLKKAGAHRQSLAFHLMTQGLYNHTPTKAAMTPHL